jgi:hypothetical protein
MINQVWKTVLHVRDGRITSDVDLDELPPMWIWMN